jgi:predicted secreted hydrolase
MPKTRRSGASRVRFPEDEGAHPDSHAEWWYGHFSLTSADGGEYGAVAAYFNVGLKILAVSDLREERLHHKVSSSALHAANGRLNLHWGGRDHWRRTRADSLTYRIESYSPDIGLDLSLRSLKPPLPGCGTGVIKWTGGSAHYYQLTRLEATGRIELPGRALEVQGIGVMDHQWMNYLGEEGWDWLCVQLDNGAEAVFWHLVNPDGSVKSRDLTVMSADGSVYHTRRFNLEKLETWVSPLSEMEYCTAWRVRERRRGLDLELRARYPNQEIRMFEGLAVPIFPFWEGNMAVSGHMDGGAVSGVGYAEQVRPPSGGRAPNGGR